MKKCIILLIITLCSCNNNNQSKEELQPFPTKDSLLILADEVMDLFVEKENKQKIYIDSIRDQLHHNTNLTAQQMQNLRQQIYVHKEEIVSYEGQIELYETRVQVFRDTIIYHFIHDTIFQHHMVRDTIYDTTRIHIVDTIRTKIKWKKKKR
jgi:hypothetical protein